MTDLFSEFIRFEETEEERPFVPILPKARGSCQRTLSKEEERKIKNRAAALSSRQKKKEKLEELERLVGMLTQENTKLKSIINELKKENEELKARAIPMSPISIDDDFICKTSDFLFSNPNKSSLMAFGFLFSLIFLFPFMNVFTISGSYSGRSLLQVNTNNSIIQQQSCLSKASFSGGELIEFYRTIKDKFEYEAGERVPLLSDKSNRDSTYFLSSQDGNGVIVSDFEIQKNTFVCNQLIKLSNLDFDSSEGRMSMVLPIGFMKKDPKAVNSKAKNGYDYVKLDLRIIGAEIVKYSHFFC